MRMFIVLVLMALPAFASAQAPSVAAAKTTVTQWFNGYEFVPTEAHFKRVGPHLEPALIQLAADAAQPLHIRARAISSLVHTPTESAGRALAIIAEATGGESLLRRKAVRVLGAVFQDQYLDLIVSVYEHAGNDLPLKEACARAMTEMPTNDRVEQVRAALYRKTQNPLLRGQLAPKKRIQVAPPVNNGVKLPRAPK
jgi:hypothetical protein